MVLKPAAPRDSEEAAHRRWLITVAITVLFGTFGAVMTYLTYARGARPWSGRAPSTAPVTAPIIAPAAPPSEAPPAAEPSSSAEDKDKDKEDKDK